MYRLMMAFALTVGLASQVAAQTTPSQDFCGKSGAAGVAAVAALLEGTWTMTHQAGYMLAGAMTFPVPPSAPEQLKLRVQNGVLYAVRTGSNEKEKMALKPVDSLAWSFQNQPGASGLNPTLTDKDIQAKVKCKAADLPRLIGEMKHDLGGKNARRGVVPETRPGGNVDTLFSGPDYDYRRFYNSKGTMYVTLRLFPMTPTSMFGILSMTGSAKGVTSGGDVPLRSAFKMERSVIMSKN